MATRNFQELTRLINKIKVWKMINVFDDMYQNAREMHRSLERLQELKKAIIQMDQKKILEIKNYTNPPRLVHEVIIATLLLLGEPETHTQVIKLYVHNSTE